MAVTAAAAAAAAAVAPAQQPVSPQVVGNAFVQQYYHILHHSPGLVHRFYQDISKLGRPETDGSMSITTTMQAINDKILSLNYGDYKAEIKSVDAQDSFSGGVHVLVAGYMTGKDNMIRNFAQTFFLAPQDRGYFVLNDIFRYVDNVNEPDEIHGPSDDGAPSMAPPVAPIVAPVAPPVVPEQNPLPVHDDDNIENGNLSSDDIYVVGSLVNTPEDGNVPVVEEEMPVAEVVDEVQDDSQMVIESNTKFEELPKKSYASIVMDLKESAAAFSSPAPAPRKVINKVVEQVNSPPAPASDVPVLSQDVVENGNGPEGEADGYSIYIKGLPLNATNAMLAEEFKKFGPIKNGGIQVRSNRGFCFGFVEFEVASAVEKAIEASPIMIGGRQAVVEEKRSTNSRVNNRGRFQSGRGLGFRNEGARGRGNFGGGRGYSRGDYNGRAEFGNRGTSRGGSSSRGGDGYQRSDSIGSTGGRNRVAGLANGTAKSMAPRVSATA